MEDSSKSQSKEASEVNDLHENYNQSNFRSKTRMLQQDFFEIVFTRINKTLFVFKLFYFFFYGAFGSLLPLISVYFKQLGLNSTQIGVLVGIRPFLEFVSLPFWGMLADRYQRGKTILLCALFALLVFTASVGFVKPNPRGCLVPWNTTTHFMVTPNFKSEQIAVIHGVHPIKLDRDHVTGIDASELPHLVIPMHGTVVYNTDQVNRVFVIILVLIMIGEVLSSPAIALADSAVLNYLTEHGCLSYGRQRMFGSLGWGLVMFCVGIALDLSTTYPGHPCTFHNKSEKNYTICFAVYTVFMLCAMLTATQLSFVYYEKSSDKPIKSFESNDEKQKIVGYPVGYDAYKETKESFNKPSNDAEVLEAQLNIKLENKADEYPIGPADELVDPYGDDLLFASYKFSQWGTFLRQFGTASLIAVLLLAWFMGLGAGIVFTFLFWHLQDLGGSPILFGVASIINHISEVLAYFFSGKIIAKFGHVKILYVGLFCNTVRFLYISWLVNPWWVLPFEFLQGITQALVWAACCAYITQSIPKEYRISSQGVLQGLYHGLGKGLGGVIGGIVISYGGSRVAFRSYGVACCVALLLYVMLNYYLENQEFQKSLMQLENDGVTDKTPLTNATESDFLQEGGCFAPHGVPFGPDANQLMSNNSTAYDQKNISKNKTATDGRRVHDSGNIVYPSTYTEYPQYE